MTEAEIDEDMFNFNVKILDNWTAECFICKSKRNLKHLDVRRIDMYPSQPGIAIFNMKYCNDSISCIDKSCVVNIDNIKKNN